MPQWSFSSVAAVLLVASLWPPGVAQAAPDTRQPIQLNPDHQAMVLQEMRTMLEAVQGILAGLADGHRKTAADAARRAGMEMARAMPPALQKALPRDFRRLGMRTHRGFDELAVAIRQGESRTMILDRLSNHLTNCTGCHAGYKLTGR
jgi:hypothetical protein